MPTPSRNPKSFRNNQPMSQHSPICSRSDEWKKKWLTPQNPFFHCGEAGHWAPNCPARKKAANARFSSSQRKIDIASIGAIPAMECDEALLDSGVTHSVVGDISPFSTMQEANITLLVASSHQFMVDTIGDITLTTLQGQFTIKNVILCPEITGVVLSIGQMISQGIPIKFLNDDFHVQQRNISFSTIKKNFHWFIPFHCPSSLMHIHTNHDLTPPPINLSICPVFDDKRNINELWHQRLGNLSIRNLKLLVQFKAAEGIANFNFDHIKICHPYSISKA
ncbi:hypothetical protein O181_063283 [Austropuccinia psidii MF-1]|uniref:Retrovirus-related Pol polyprotein from transposon TNT 1-94-like beta-barrel domain-containing protein n=1 Tax=Austropuccinia psidii MF-1 TaxID=1389203 RepID=A0A9Q3I0G0_9BASI|nr:hypothetical protein [Austropuccinia psidii MF-1]